MSEYIDIVFDGPPGPVCGRFVEVEDDAGASISVGEWVETPPYWVLRISNNKHLTELEALNAKQSERIAELEAEHTMARESLPLVQGLRKMIADWKQKTEEAVSVQEQYADAYVESELRAETTEAENVKLREALQKIVDYIEVLASAGIIADITRLWTVRDEAQAALAKGDKKC